MWRRTCRRCGITLAGAALNSRRAVTVNGQPVKANTRISEGDCIAVQLPQPTEVKAENIPLDIVFEDEDVIVIDKPRGMVVHPAAGHRAERL